MGLWAFWSFYVLAFALMDLFQPKFKGQAEISSLGAKDRFRRLEVTARVTRISEVLNEVDKTKVLSAFETEAVDAFKLSNSEQVYNEAQRVAESGAPISVKTEPNTTSRLKIFGEKYEDTFEDDHIRPNASMGLENNFSDVRTKAKRSVGISENVDQSMSGETRSRERVVETAQSVANSRTEYRRSGEEARGTNPRQSEPHLDTSTFALSGDSAHNQAMVHWSGHNSSVSSSFT